MQIIDTVKRKNKAVREYLRAVHGFAVNDKAQMVENIIGWAIGILMIAILVIGVALPTALDSIAAINKSNMTSATQAILGLFGIFIALGAVIRVWVMS